MFAGYVKILDTEKALASYKQQLSDLKKSLAAATRTRDQQRIKKRIKKLQDKSEKLKDRIATPKQKLNFFQKRAVAHPNKHNVARLERYLHSDEYVEYKDENLEELYTKEEKILQKTETAKEKRRNNREQTRSKEEKQFDLHHVAIQGSVQTHEYEYTEQPAPGMHNLKPTIIKFIESAFPESSIKIQITTTVKYIDEDNGGKDYLIDYTSSVHVMTVISNKTKTLQTMSDEIIDKIYNQNHKNYAKNIVDGGYINVELFEYLPLTANKWFPTPEALKNRGIVNPINKSDDNCFYWACVISDEYVPGAKNPGRISKYKKDRFKPESYQAPMPICNDAYMQFEMLNNIRLNVYVYEPQDDIYYASNLIRNPANPLRTINILIVYNPEDDTQIHYMAIVDMDKFMCNITKHKERKYFCTTCFCNFQTQESKDTHDCNQYQTTTMPKPDTTKKFINYKNTVIAPFSVSGKITTLSEKQTHTYNHIAQDVYVERPIGYTLKLDCINTKYSMDPITYFGDNCMKNFFHHLKQISLHVDESIEQCQRLHRYPELTPEEEIQHENAHNCFYCKEEFRYKPEGKRRNMVEVPKKPKNIKQLPLIDIPRNTWSPQTFHGPESKILIDATYEDMELDDGTVIRIRTGGYRLPPTTDHDEVARRRHELVHESRQKTFKLDGFICSPCREKKRQQGDCETQNDTVCVRCGEQFYPSAKKRGYHKSKSFINGIFTGAVHYKCRTPEEGNIALTVEQKARYDDLEDTCVACNEPFDTYLDKVRDRDLITNKFRASSCGPCNSRLQLNKYTTIPVLIHGFHKFESHLITEQFNKNGEHEDIDISVIPSGTKGSFSSITLGRFRFLDSKKFVDDDLSKWVQTIKGNTTTQHFPILSEHHNISPKPAPRIDPQHKNLHKRLEDRNEWAITNKVRTNLEYLKLSTEIDVLLLADCFTYYRKNLHDVTGLDPIHYYGYPGFSYDVLFKVTNQEIQLLSDRDMFEFFERQKRGGISGVGLRHAKANNKYMIDYDPKKPTSFNTHDDFNSQYAKCMMMPLPTKNFIWTEEFANLTLEQSIDKINNIPDDNTHGYTFEVDVSFPLALHDKFDELPPLSDKKTVSVEEYSDYHCQFELPKPSEKLMQTLEDKKNYVIDYRYLKFVLSLGMKLDKVHRVLKYEQSPWMKPFIDKFAKLRGETDNDFMKALYKGMLVAPFGKTFEDVRRYKDFKFVTTPKQLHKHTKMPRFAGNMMYFHDDLIGFQMGKKKVLLNKPIYLGVTIMDLSKIMLMDYHYNYIKKLYPGSKSRMLKVETDALAYNIQTEDIYQDRIGDDQFDFSAYPKDHPCYNSHNKKVPGKMSDEWKNRICTEYIALMARTNVALLKDPHQKEYETTMKTKGLPKSFARNALRFENFKHALEHDEKQYLHFHRIGIKHNKLVTREHKMVSLTGFDNKRFALDAYRSRAYGHKDNTQKK